jgi:hypothetical protein
MEKSLLNVQNDMQTENTPENQPDTSAQKTNGA